MDNTLDYSFINDDDEENHKANNNKMNEETETITVQEDTIQDKAPNHMANLEHANLIVKCEIGTVLITLKQLTSLKSGDVIDIGELFQLAKLTINGSYVAQGELVNIDGRLGIKLHSNNSIFR